MSQPPCAYTLSTPRIAPRSRLDIHGPPLVVQRLPVKCKHIRVPPSIAPGPRHHHAQPCTTHEPPLGIQRLPFKFKHMLQPPGSTGHYAPACPGPGMRMDA
jgi:hypothetical protein